MQQFSSHEPDRFYFTWPEPLIIDLIEEHYTAMSDRTERLAISKFHAGLLRQLLDGACRESMALRLDLMVYCKSRGIPEAAINGADRAVFWELSRMLESRCRHSSRKRREIGRLLQSAFEALSPGTEPPRRTVAAPAQALPAFAMA